VRIISAQPLIGFTIDRTGGYGVGYDLMMSFLQRLSFAD
jgi:hypothetical protein